MHSTKTKMNRRVAKLVFWMYWGVAGVSCAPDRMTLNREGRRAVTQAKAAKIMGELEGEDQVSRLQTEQILPSAPTVLIGEAKECPFRTEPEPGERAGLSATAHSMHPVPASQNIASSLKVKIDESGRPWAPCKRLMLDRTPYYGYKGASKVNVKESTTVGDLKQVTDLTRLGLDAEFNKKAYEGAQICNGFFFSGSRPNRTSSDPACVLAHLDASSASIRALDPSSLKPLHPKLNNALIMASTFSSSKERKEWTRRLINSPSLRLAWHVVQSFSEKNVDLLEVNVGEVLNSIVLKDMSLLRPLEDLIRFATTCVTYEDYPEMSLQDPIHYPSPDSPKYKSYPIYDYLRGAGAEVSFPKEMPVEWQPCVFDGNRSTPRAAGERENAISSGNWKQQVYTSWHNLWVLNLITYDAGSMWHWSQNLKASTFFFKPWKVTRVGTLRMAEAGPLRYDDLSPRFRVDTSTSPREDDYAACSKHLTDFNFFNKVHTQKGLLVAEWRKQSAWLPRRMLGEHSVHCKFSRAAVPCPPKVHPDKCGLDASYVSSVESPWLYRLERDDAGFEWNVDDTHSDYVDRIWSARGTAFPKLWLLNSMHESRVDPELSPSGKGRIHSGFLFLFRKAAEKMIADDIREVSEKVKATGRREVVLFTGHSLGGAVAQIAAWYYAVKCKNLIQKGLLQIRCVTFGTPAWGNDTAYKELKSAGVLVHDIATNVDPVTTINGEPDFGHGLQWRKPFHFRIMLQDMAKVVVASASPMEPDFFGQLWTRQDLHAGNFLRRMFGALANMQNVDSIFLNPVLSHFLSYTAVLTIMADFLPEAGYGSSLAAPLMSDPPIVYASHPVNDALANAQTKMNLVMHRIVSESGHARKTPGKSAENDTLGIFKGHHNSDQHPEDQKLD